MYNTKFVQKLAFAYRNCPLSLETTKHFLAYTDSFLWSGIENFPKCAIYDIVNGLIVIFAHRTVRKTRLGNIFADADIFGRFCEFFHQET